jgi:trans-2,3-dihydro-3-hydroxyanthranilate isomerase
MNFEFYTLDVFTNRKFGGNPLAVVLDAEPLNTGQMQTITREFNLSETVFVMAPDDPTNTAKVRIFFPGGEMPFAGHPTLGTAILLAELKQKPGCSFETTIRLEEKAGLVPVRVSRIGGLSNGIFTAPVIPFEAKGALPSLELAARAVGLAQPDIGFDTHKIGLYEGGPRFLYLPVASRSALERTRATEPYWSEMIKAAGVDCAYLYTQGGDKPETNYRSRMYAPTAGIIEDPATGSATAILAAQLLKAEKLKDGKHKFVLEQGYEMGRPSDLVLELNVDQGKLKSVQVGGSAVQMMKGILSL